MGEAREPTAPASGCRPWRRMFRCQCGFRDTPARGRHGVAWRRERAGATVGEGPNGSLTPGASLISCRIPLKKSVVRYVGPVPAMQFVVSLQSHCLVEAEVGRR